MNSSGRTQERPSPSLAGRGCEPSSGRYECICAVCGAHFFHDNKRALICSGCKVESAASWRPIETAPKDGTHFLACENAPTSPYGPTWGFNQRPPVVVHWWGNPGEEGFYLSAASTDPLRLTHWMPFVAPPAGSRHPVASDGEGERSEADLNQTSANRPEKPE